MRPTYGYDIARSNTIAVTPGGHIHLPDEDCDDTHARWYKAFPGRAVSLDDAFLMIVDCPNHPEHCRAYGKDDGLTMELCGECYVATFLPEAEMVYVMASSRDRELEMVKDVGAEKWTPFSEGDALTMSDGNQKVTANVLLDDSDDSLILLTPAMLRLVISGRLHVVLMKREEPEEAEE